MLFNTDAFDSARSARTQYDCRMAQPKPSLAARLMARHPISGVSTSSTAAGSDDLAAASSAYAKHASQQGATGPWWRVWRAIERTRGHRLAQALVSLKPEARRWFALWSFGRGRTKEGATAYRAYLAHPGRIGPFDAENAIYLGHMALRKAPSEVVRIADELMAKTSANRDVSRIVLATLLATGEAEELRRRYPRPMGATLHDGDAWARYALAAANTKAASESAFALTMCAKLGVGSRNDTALLDLLLKTLSLSSTEWSHLRAPWDYPSDVHREVAGSSRGPPRGHERCQSTRLWRRPFRNATLSWVRPSDASLFRLRRGG